MLWLECGGLGFFKVLAPPEVFLHEFVIQVSCDTPQTVLETYCGRLTQECDFAS